MTRFERRLLVETGLLGVALTVLIVLLAQFGVLRTLELMLDDERAKYFQHYRTKPTDQLIHLDIDDKSIDVIGRPPWSRDKWAKILDELNTAGVKVVAMDVTFQDKEDPIILGDGQPALDPDKLMADAMARFRSQPGRGVFLPLTINVNAVANSSALYNAVVEELDKDMELDDATLSQHLIARGFSEEEVRQKTTAVASAAIQEVMFRRIKHELDSGHGADVESLRQRLLPHSAATGLRNDAFRTLEQILPSVKSFQEMLRFSRSRPAGLPPFLSQDTQTAPIPILAEAIAYSGFVDFWKVDDAVVRCTPLWIMNRGRLIPQMGLSMACAQLGVNPNDIQLAPDSMTIPLPAGGSIVVPVYSRRGDNGNEVGMLMDIPWWGKEDGWQTMYDWPNYKLSAQHFPVTSVWNIISIEQDVIDNNQKALEEVCVLDGQEDSPEAAQRARQTHPPFTDIVAWNKLMQDTLSNMPPDLTDTYKDYLNNTKDIDTLTTKTEHDLVLSLRNLLTRPGVNKELEINRTELRNKLRRQFQDKAVLIGSIASSEMDFRATPLDKECPGDVVHGAIFNAIMTRDLLTREPPWVALIWTLIVGLIVSFASAAFPPIRALISAAVIAAIFIWFDFSFAYDQHRMEIDAAGPPTAASLIWAGCTLTRFIREQKEKKHITERFRSYVDPSLVKYVLEHPEKATLEGEERELSVVFTDLQGFTSVSEVLKRETVSLLNEYLGLMVPVITKHHGLVNKFLGDGIMFFFGAPEPYPGDPSLHALAAVQTVVEMQQVMIPFNEELVRRRLPALKMRAGVSTGDMVVGDAGPRGRSDYTVLGDRVNFAARLESANKYTGTPILISDRTVELLQNKYLVRPVGRLQVVGKNEPVLTYEPIISMDMATPEHHKLVEMTRAVTESYAGAHFADCIAATHELLTTFGEASQGKLCALYRRLSLEYLRVPPKDFRGQIKLEAK